MELFKNYPSGIAGLSLGISAFGIALTHFFPSISFWAMTITGATAILLLLPLFLKFIFNFHFIWDDLQTPYEGSLLPTITMSTMIIGSDLFIFNHTIGYIVWFCGLFIHLAVTGCFIFCMLRNFRFEFILPSWFIPPVGILVACITMPNPQLMYPLHYVFYLGFGTLLILLPLVLIRLIINDRLRDEVLPSLCIVAAPANLCLIGYLNVFTNPDLLLTIFLFSAGTIPALLVYVSLPKLVTLPFTPGFSSFTFPSILIAIATFDFAHHIKALPLFAENYLFLLNLAYGELVIAIGLLLFVIFHYCRHLMIMLLKHSQNIPVN